MDSLKINYKIFLDAEDVSWHRILTAAQSISNAVKNHQSTYINQAEVTNESDTDDEVFRLYFNETIEEEVCSNPEDAGYFMDDMADLLSAIAHMHSYFDMEGEFSIQYKDMKAKYHFTSESGSPICEFEEL